MTKRTITEEQLKALLGKMEINSMCHFMEIMAAAFPPKFKAEHNQVIAVSDIEGDFSANTFQKFMHMSEDRYECLGSSHLQGDTTYHWQFARALTSEDLGGAEVDDSNVAPDVTVDQSFDLELESSAVGQLSDRLDKLEKAPREKFATREDLASLLATLINAFSNIDGNFMLLRADDIDLLKDLKKVVLR
jgi:hypothetical protein